MVNMKNINGIAYTFLTTSFHSATELGVVCHEVQTILRGRVLVGHGLKHDLDVLMIKHPKSNIRDTSRQDFFLFPTDFYTKFFYFCIFQVQTFSGGGEWRYA